MLKVKELKEKVDVTLRGWGDPGPGGQWHFTATRCLAGKKKKIGAPDFNLSLK